LLDEIEWCIDFCHLFHVNGSKHAFGVVGLRLEGSVVVANFIDL